jgi:SAM-dependent methyltransferase
MLNKLENFLYKKIIRSLMFTSWLGRRVVTGHADSAINFAHIYKNKAKGYTILGKAVDRILLNFPSAKATRNRKNNISKIVKREINNNIKRNRKTRIVDLASGPATYLLELITKNNEDWVEILCLDVDKRSLMLGRKMSAGKPFLFKRGDAARLHPFIRISNARKWKPNLVLASGLFFYYNDNFAKKLFKEISTVIDDDGLFLFDNLIGNPNKKLLSKVGVTRSGKPWEFYYREPSLIKSWLFDEGFNKADCIRDKWNMYVLYEARKGNS